MTRGDGGGGACLIPSAISGPNPLACRPPELPVHVFVVNLPGEGMQKVVSLLPEDVVFARGLVPQAVLGKLLRGSSEGDALAMDNFVENNAFAVFLHDVVSRFAPGMVAFREQAKQLGAGHVYVIDGRTPTPQGDVPASDVIGAFRVEFGNVVAGSYTANNAPGATRVPRVGTSCALRGR